MGRYQQANPTFCLCVKNARLTFQGTVGRSVRINQTVVSTVAVRTLQYILHR